MGPALTHILKALKGRSTCVAPLPFVSLFQNDHRLRRRRSIIVAGARSGRRMRAPFQFIDLAPRLSAAQCKDIVFRQFSRANRIVHQGADRKLRDASLILGRQSLAEEFLESGLRLAQRTIARAPRASWDAASRSQPTRVPLRRSHRGAPASSPIQRAGPLERCDSVRARPSEWCPRRRRAGPTLFAPADRTQKGSRRFLEGPRLSRQRGRARKSTRVLRAPVL